MTGHRYLQYCVDFCTEHQVTLFYPGKEASLISANQDRFAAVGTKVISVGSAATLDMLHDKADFYQRYLGADTPTPDFAVVDNFPAFEEAYARMRREHAVLSIKPTVGVYGIGFRVIDEHRRALTHILGGIDYHVALPDLRRELEATGTFKPLLLMEYLSGDEFSVDCLASHGRLRCAIPRRKGRDSRQGQVIEVRSDILAACTTIASNEGLNAIFNVQFRLASDGRLKLLEVNPRMSGGTGMSCLAGPNLPYLAVRDAIGLLRDEDIPAIRSGLRVGEIQQAVVFP